MRNELCLLQNTKADALLKDFTTVNPDRDDLLEKWKDILDEVKKTSEYNSSFTYGLDQICKEIDIKDGKEYKYKDLHQKIVSFKKDLKVFYDKHIAPKCFKYELLK